MNEALPRSQQTVERLARVAVRRITRGANLAAIGFVSFGTLALFGGLAWTFWGEHSDPEFTWQQGVAGAVAAFVLLGLVMGYVVRRMLIANVDELRGLLALGSAFRGLVTGYRKSSKGMHELSLIWREGERDARAMLEIYGAAPVGQNRAVTVFSRSGISTVAVLFGDNEVFMGRRVDSRR